MRHRQGHEKQILGLDFGACGVRLATGSDDNTIRLWDVRKTKVSSPLHLQLENPEP